MYQIVNRLKLDADAELAELAAGLLARPASIAPKYFYDRLGCALFGAICALDEYYPTRTEAKIFADNRDAIAAAVGTGGQFVDLGAGDCAKGAFWLPMLAPTRYLAVDVAADTLDRALSALAAEHPAIEMVGIATDFSRRLDLAADLAPLPTTFFYPGSSIGNFGPDEAHAFLRQIRALAGPEGRLLIGVDTKKHAARLDAAYDDALGVTAAFNRNVLRHVNRRLGSNFDVAAFAHRAFYVPAEGRIEMHLEAVGEQRVRIGSRERVYADGERIHTENSYKYAPSEFAALLDRAGFARIQRWLDDAGDFSVFFAR